MFPSADKYKNLPEMEGDDFDTAAELTKLSGGANVRERLLGLHEVREWTEAEALEILGNARRYHVFQNITTNTMPIAERTRQKQAIVLALVEGGCVSDAILRNCQVVYIGSGMDIEYPLALGARRITLLDPIFSEEQARNAVIDKLQHISSKTTPVEIDTDESATVSFEFPFRESIDETEIVTVRLLARPYDPSAEETLLDGAGLVLLFAAQGPNGRVELSADTADKLTEGGAVLQENTLTLRDSHTISLGHT